jgi:hypothetical protein
VGVSGSVFCASCEQRWLLIAQFKNANHATQQARNAAILGSIQILARKSIALQQGHADQHQVSHGLGDLIRQFGSSKIFVDTRVFLSYQ